jgi:8-oxo-dGTP pyrophosphatase MutT (NUDIX family)
LERWKRIESVPAISSKWLTVDCNTYITPAGLLRDYYILTRSHFVLVIATDDDSVILVRQYRPATDRFYLALPGGYIEPGESEESAARRELKEETGFDGLKWNYLGELHPLPGYVSSSAHVFSCRVDKSSRPVSITEQDIAEETEVVPVKYQEMLQKITTGEIIEMQALSAILLGLLHRCF